MSYLWYYHNHTLVYKAARILCHTCFTTTFLIHECVFRSHINAWLQVASSLHFPFMKHAMDVNGTNVQKGYITILAGILCFAYISYSHFNSITMHIMSGKFRLSYYISICHVTTHEMLNFQNSNVIEHFHKNNVRTHVWIIFHIP